LIDDRSVKDFRRRTSQSILATVGSAETTKDEVFDVHIEKFEKMFLEMNERTFVKLKICILSMSC
jgi:hypothetical protein